jgi:hypothetical protein
MSETKPKSRVPNDPADQLPLELNPPSIKNIYQRLNEVRKVVDYVKKDKHVDGAGGGYKVVSHDQITALTRGALIEQGVLIVPVEQASQTVLSGAVTSKNVPYVRFEPRYAIRFVNMDNPEDVAEVVLTVHAVDVGDKAPGKALSYAVKAALLKILNIETGEEDESRYGDDEPKAAPVAAKGDEMMPRPTSSSAPAAAPVGSSAADDAAAEPGEIAFITTKLKLLKTDSPAEILQASGVSVTWDATNSVLVGALSKTSFATVKAALKGKK